jgi:hypothetical protein
VKSTRIILLLCLTLIGGCQSSAKKKAAKLEQQRKVEESYRLQTANLAVTASGWTEEGEEISTATKMWLDNATNPLIKPHLDAIERIHRTVGAGIKNADKALIKNQQDYAAVVKRAEGAEDDRDNTLFTWTTLGIVAGGFIIVCGVVASLVSRRYPLIPFLAIGTDVAAGGWLMLGISLGLRLGLRAVGPYLKIAGLVIVVCCCSTIIWFTWRALRRVKVKRELCDTKQALVEVVATGEKVKARPEVPNEVFAMSAPGIQSEKTKAMVAEARQLIAPLADETGVVPVPVVDALPDGDCPPVVPTPAKPKAGKTKKRTA